jgi:hypothetical protein
MLCRFSIPMASWPTLCSLTELDNGWWQVSDITGERSVAIFRNATCKVHVYPSGRAVASSEIARAEFLELARRHFAASS